ncbi:MAG: hypothetical protein JWP09_831 [Candidatus Taylorbacteria bacterium]|nr:hypothetical protein [Candidatus Taylorbacteria bacterium]
MNLEDLFAQGFGFVRNGDLKPFPFDHRTPVRSGSEFGVTKESVREIASAWTRWRNIVKSLLANKEADTLIRNQVTPSDQIKMEWSHVTPDYERYFGNPLHVTRIDLTIDTEGKLRILDPNVMPYGIPAIVAAGEALGLTSHKQYLQALKSSGVTWVCDDYHGGLPTVEWLCRYAGISFCRSSNFKGAHSVIRLSREDVRGMESTVGISGIRVYESQLWPALINLGATKIFGLNVNAAQLEWFRNMVTQTYLAKISGGKALVAVSMDTQGFYWIPFEEFCRIHNTCSRSMDKIFVKRIHSSGSRSVSFCDATQVSILECAASNKVGIRDNEMFLIQPAVSCTIGSSRVRIALYIGYQGQCIGAEVLRVAGSKRIAHGSSDSKVSYLTF